MTFAQTKKCGVTEMLKPKHPCAQPGCKAICSGRFCANHRPKRTSGRSQGYSCRRDKYSAEFLQRNPQCCDLFGRHRGQLFASTVTAHRKAHRLLWSPTNRYPLCASCNAAQCVLEEGGFGNERRTNSETTSERSPLKSEWKENIYQRLRLWEIMVVVEHKVGRGGRNLSETRL